MSSVNSSFSSDEIVQRVPRGLKQVLDAILYSNLVVAAAAASLSWSTFLFWRQPLPPRLGLFIFSATLFLYNLDSALPYKYTRPALLSGRKHWMLVHRKALLGLAAASLALAGWALWAEANLPLLVFLGHLAAVAVFYSLPVVRWQNKWRSLREVPLLKGFLIAYVWAAVSVWLPALHLGKPLASPVVALLFGRRFFFILALTFVFDIRDYTKDRLSGTHTFPGLLGVATAKLLALLALLVSGLLVPAAIAGPHLVWYTLPLGLAALLVVFAREGRSDYYFALLADGVMLTPFLAAYGTLM
ncbi:hypothetical protein FY528_04300 [Hymenobacter lutimineralis]|uniref:Prenyltransferase n=1 Tax=Hymenobacter lutimineralis TaxID=2606448 RepID=A0A5D6VDA1_9BACT|nr:UbiA family prenyltransferase [Hymenobacter lutimineralis]TYZ12524.1 hypothetical protein FY528_04300 [Hymenobacter lutimineralis]